MKIVAVLALLFALAPRIACAQDLTPQEAQATLSAARADADRARVQATAISRLATANAPTATPWPTWTPQPTQTPWPTVTPEPTATATAQPTDEPTATIAPAATMQATAQPTLQPTAQAPANAQRDTQRGRTIYDDWPLLLLLGLGALAMVVGLSRLIDGKTITLPGRSDRGDK
jgi:hypothetical protein